jgi:hypothetical protein
MLPSTGVVNGNLHHILCVSSHLHPIYRQATEISARSSNSATYGDTPSRVLLANALRMGEFERSRVCGGAPASSLQLPGRLPVAGDNDPALPRARGRGTPYPITRNR